MFGRSVYPLYKMNALFTSNCTKSLFYVLSKCPLIILILKERIRERATLSFCAALEHWTITTDGAFNELKCNTLHLYIYAHIHIYYTIMQYIHILSKRLVEA